MYVSTIHRFWAGRPMPEAYEAFGREWERLNPGWDVQMFTEDDLLRFPALGSVFDSMYERDDDRRGIELFVQLADVMGYAIVEAFGGVYVNCDIEPVRPLTMLPLPDTAWASYENHVDGRIVNAAIGAPLPHHPFWRDLLSGLPRRYFSNPTAEMVETTGPAYLTDFARTRQDLHVFAVEAFNPTHWSQIPFGGDASGFSYPENTIGVHHWGHKKDHRSNVIETATQ